MTSRSVGIKREIWTKIIFALNTSGLVLTNNHTSSIRVDEEHREITITPLLGRAHRYKFERIYVFDDDVARRASLRDSSSIKGLVSKSPALLGSLSSRGKRFTIQCR